MSDERALFLHRLRIVEGCTRLGDTNKKQVWELVRLHAKQRTRALFPVFTQLDATAAISLQPSLPSELHQKVETGRIDDGIDGILVALHNDTVRRDLLNTLTVGINQGDIVPVESIQVLVTETGPLTEVVVPRL